MYSYTEYNWIFDEKNLNAESQAEIFDDSEVLAMKVIKT